MLICYKTLHGVRPIKYAYNFVLLYLFMVISQFSAQVIFYILHVNCLHDSCDVLQHLTSTNDPKLLIPLAKVRCVGNSQSLIFEFIIENSKLGTCYKTALKWMPQNLINEKSALVQAMTWCHQATSHYLSEPMLTTIYVTIWRHEATISYLTSLICKLWWFSVKPDDPSFCVFPLLFLLANGNIANCVHAADNSEVLTR